MLKTLLSKVPASDTSTLVFAPNNLDPVLHETVQSLRSQGYRIVYALGDEKPPAHCEKQLIYHQGQWQLAPC